MTIEIIGAGVVGGAFGRALAHRGHPVRWIDTRPDRVSALRAQGLAAARPDEAVEPADTFVLCVPTPTGLDGQERGPLQAALLRVARCLQAERQPTVVIRSTILPGTSRQWALPLLEQAAGLRCGTDFQLLYCPEFLREPHAEADAATPRIQLLGEPTPGAGDRFSAVLADFEAPIVRLCVEAAELQKYVHNTFNATKIAFFNEMRRVAASLGLDPETEVEAIFAATRVSAEALWNPLYGLRAWGPIGGHCLPKDLTALVHWSRQRGEAVPLLEGVLASNVPASRQPGPPPAAGGS